MKYELLESLNDEETKVFVFNGKKYKMMLDSEDRKPCEKCAVRKECEDDDCDDYLMLCGCEFCNEPWYVAEVSE